jgi:branched-chain amino acid transport system substrate-binding protein
LEEEFMKLARVGVAIAAAAIIVSACTGSDTGSSAAPSGAVSTPAPAASDAPSAAPVDDPLGVVQIPAGEPLHIALWGVLSGPDSSLGEDSKQGAEIAIDDQGGSIMGHDIRLTTEDGLCTPDGGAIAAQKLAADSTIVGLIGSSCSDETVGGIASLTAAGLTTISPANTRPDLTDPNRDASYAGYLRTAHSDAFQGKAAAEFAYSQLKLTKAATIHDGSTYAEALQGVFVEEFQKLGGTITAQEAVTKDTTDMSAVLKTVATSKPEAIYFPVFVAAAGFLRAQIGTVSGLENVVTMGADGHFTPDFLKAAGAAAVGHYLSSPNFGAFGPGYADLLAKREAKFGGSPLSVFHAHAYDATNILFAAIEKVAVENADGSLSVPKGALRDAIYATKDFPGLTGTLSCSPSGDCGAPVIAAYQIEQDNVTRQIMPDTPVWP